MGPSSFFHHTLAYIKHSLKSKNAHGLHSPFVFDLYNQVIKKAHKYHIKEVEALRQHLLKNENLIDVTDFKTKKTKRKTVKSIAKSSLSTPDFASLLHLLVNYLKVDTILETGTSFGITTSYLGLSQAKKIISLEGSPILSQMASKNIQKLKLKNVEITSGNIHQSFTPNLVKHQPDFIFLDADHRGSITWKLVDQILKQEPKPKCIVVHDIYWSKDMSNTWFQLTRDPRIRLTLDIFQAGIIFPHRESPKQHFILRF